MTTSELIVNSIRRHATNEQTKPNSRILKRALDFFTIHNALFTFVPPNNLECDINFIRIDWFSENLETILSVHFTDDLGDYIYTEYQDRVNVDDVDPHTLVKLLNTMSFN